MYTGKYKGKYKVKNPAKYAGDIQNVVYRSSWELKFMVWCDNNTSILEWGSEIAVIPYKSPVDNRMHRYFVDFYIKVRDETGTVKKYLIEIKPLKYTQPPVNPGKPTKKFLQEVFQYGVNQAKWEQADKFCKENNMKFLVLTEKDLGVSS